VVKLKKDCEKKSIGFEEKKEKVHHNIKNIWKWEWFMIHNLKNSRFFGKRKTLILEELYLEKPKKFPKNNS